MFKTAGTEELEGPQNGLHASLNKVYQKTAMLPDCDLKSEETGPPAEDLKTGSVADAGKTVSGLVGASADLAHGRTDWLCTQTPLKEHATSNEKFN